MAIVIRNDRAQGRFFRYRVDGFPKSVWLDGFSEILIPELKDTSTMLNRTERARIERVEASLSSINLSNAALEVRTNSFVDISNTLRWKPVIMSLRTGLDTYIFSSNGRNFVVGVEPKTNLRVGVKVVNVTSGSIDSLPNGDYLYKNMIYSVFDSSIQKTTQLNGEDEEVIWNSFIVKFLDADREYTVYTKSPDKVYERNVVWYSVEGKEDSIWTSPVGAFEYSGTSLWSIVLNNRGQVESSQEIVDDDEDGKITYIGFQVKDSELKTLTIYTQENETILQVGTEVFERNNGTGSVRDGVYVYEQDGSIFSVTTKSNLVITVRPEN